MTPLLRHRRSRRQPVFGQIRPLKRLPRCARTGRDLAWRTWRLPATVRIPAGPFGPSAAFVDRPACRVPITESSRDSIPVASHSSAHRAVRQFGAPAGVEQLGLLGVPISPPHPLTASARNEEWCRSCGRPFAAKRGDQAVTTPCPRDPGAAIDVTRTKAVMPTAIAPMTEKTRCQVSDGMMCFTTPCVA